jgi:hypothetical protein
MPAKLKVNGAEFELGWRFEQGTRVQVSLGQW